MYYNSIEITPGKEDGPEGVLTLEIDEVERSFYVIEGKALTKNQLSEFKAGNPCLFMSDNGVIKKVD